MPKPTVKDFNVAGPCIHGKHYMLDPLRGLGAELMSLIDREYYFVIHAARQSGKTTLLLELVDRINAAGDYRALYCNLETVQGFNEPERGIPAIVKKMVSAFRESGMPDNFATNADYGDPTNVLRDALSAYCRSLDKPLVIFFDEADCLSDMTLITFLRQLRDGYISRRVEKPFVHSIALVGMRNLRDYISTTLNDRRGKIRGDSPTLGSASPFNIVKEALNIRNFTNAEIAELYAQHTTETGQVFERQAVDYVFEQTQGQPWLVNAIACECVEKITKWDYMIPITQSMAAQAIQNIILARGTHIDSMLERLKEERVRHIIQPLITGEEPAALKSQNDDYAFTKDLGLIRDDRDRVEPANPIYAELIIRALTCDAQDKIKDAGDKYAPQKYIKDGRLDMNVLLKGFQSYWRENSEIWIKRYKEDLYEYDEAAAHLVIHAFLQRVVNGGGQVIRDMALGRLRADLCVVYGGRKYPIELKIKQSIRNNAKVLEQISAYMDKLGSNEGWLVIFDKDAEKSWDKKIYTQKKSVNGKRVTVFGC